jgi:hypothetical protein
MHCDTHAFSSLHQAIADLVERLGTVQAVTVHGDGTAPEALCLYSEMEMEGDTVLWLNQRMQGWEAEHFQAAVALHTRILLCGHQLRMAALELLTAVESESSTHFISQKRT